VPDADGNIPPVPFSLSDEEWERIFGAEIVWTPDPSLDGAYFEPE
jgi:hypothetical protein